MWQFYALQKDTTITSQPVHVRVARSYVIMGENDDDQLGKGWHQFEPALGGRWTTQQATAYCCTAARSRHLSLEYSYPAHLEQDIHPAIEVGDTSYSLPSSEQEWTRHQIALASQPDVVELPIVFRVRRTWTGEETIGNQDRRPLGIAVRAVHLTESRWRSRIQPGLGSGRRRFSDVQVSLRSLYEQAWRTLTDVYRAARGRLRGDA